VDSGRTELTVVFSETEVCGAVCIQPSNKSLPKSNVPNWEVIFTAIRRIALTHLRMGLQSYELKAIHL
jgi:hypothetical protein